ncbi:hypothetical protein EV2_032255 [Malus domestica]
MFEKKIAGKATRKAFEEKEVVGYVPEAEEEKPLMRLLRCRKSRFGGGEDSAAATEVKVRLWIDLRLPFPCNCRTKTLEFLILLRLRFCFCVTFELVVG